MNHTQALFQGVLTSEKQEEQKTQYQAPNVCTGCCVSQQQLLAQKEMQTKALKQQIVKRIPLSNDTSLYKEEAGKVAVVIPFVRCQVFGRLSQTLKSWETFPPCVLQNTARLGKKLDLIFHYNAYLDQDSDVLEGLQNLWGNISLDVRSCFQTVRFLSANLTRSEDVYPLGPCKQFYTTFDLLRRSGYDHWMQFEPDVNPIQIGWGTRLIELAEENRGCQHWWQLGSTAMYPNVVDTLNIRGNIGIDLHMNGNSVYCLKSADYDEFREKVRKSFPPSGCIGFPEIGELGGFDHAMYRFRMLPENRRYMNNKFSKFRIDDYIMNFGEAKFEPDKLLQTNPGTMLVHSKYYLITSEERMALSAKYSTRSYEKDLREAYRVEVGRFPSSGEEMFFSKLFKMRDDVGARAVWCTVRRILSASNSTSKMHPPLSDCHDADLVSLLSSTAEVTVMGLYMYYMQALPGPDADTFIEGIRKGTTSHKEIASLLCGHYLRPRDMLHNIGPCGLETRLQRNVLPETCQDWRYLSYGNILKAKCLTKSGKKRSAKLANALFCAQEIYNDNGYLRCGKMFRRNHRTLWGLMFSYFFPGFLKIYQPTPQSIDSPHVRGNYHVWEFPVLGLLHKAFPNTRMNGLVHISESEAISAAMVKVRNAEKDFTHRNFFPLKIWVTDLHASPMGCSISLFDTLQVKITAKIQFNNCIHYLDSSGQTSCANDRQLRVLQNNAWEGFGLDPCPNSLRRTFFEHYRSDMEFLQMDAVMCSHPVANCELYLPFNKSIIVYATTRLEFGRLDTNIDWRRPFLKDGGIHRWVEWLRNLRAIASSRNNLIAANNAYDAKYMEYFTGLPVKYIPSWCGGTAQSLALPHLYAPRRPDILLTPYRTNLEFTREDVPVNGWPSQQGDTKLPLDHPLFDDLWKILETQQVPFTLRTMKGAFPKGYTSLDEVSQFPAAIFIPYQTSTMSFFELYRLSIPLLVPSQTLLLSWISEHGLLWERVYGNPPRDSLLPPTDMPSPNSNKIEDIARWISLYDIYQTGVFPHLLEFDSWTDAVLIVRTVDLATVSFKMREHNIAEFARIGELWDGVLRRVRKGKEIGHYPNDIDVALRQSYGLGLLSQDTDKRCVAKRRKKQVDKVSDSEEVSYNPGSKCKKTSMDYSRPQLMKNVVLQGSYLRACKQPKFDPELNVLSCMIGKKELTLFNPYKCAEDINITPYGELSC